MSITRLSALPFSNKLIVPDNVSEMNVNQIISTMSLASIPFSGHVIMSPILARVEERLLAYAGGLAEEYGFLRLNLPTLTPKNILEASGRMEEFGSQFYHLGEPHHNYVVTPSTEESVIDYASAGLQSHRQLPMRFWHDHSVFRHHKRAEGIYKTRDIRCIVMTTIDKDQEGFLETVSLFKNYCHDFFKEIGVDVFCVEDQESGAVEFLASSELGDRTVLQSVVRRFGDHGKTNVDANLDEKYTSMSMGYPYLPVQRTGLTYQGKNGLTVPVVGTFGIGINRAIGNMLERSKNGLENAFSKAVRPFDIALLRAGKEDEQTDQSVNELARSFSRAGYRVSIDDRSIRLKDKARIAEFFSTPVRVVLGAKELEQGMCRINDRQDLVPLSGVIIRLPEFIKGN